jgi:hypothetical protein
MKTIKNYENFVNENYNINEDRRTTTIGPSNMPRVDKKYELKKGQAVVLLEDITEQDVDFRRVSDSWLGRNIYSISNEYKDNFELKKGTVLAVGVGNGKAYIGGFGDDDVQRDLMVLSEFYYNLDSTAMEKIINILLFDGKAEIVDSDKLDLSEQENNVYHTRIRYATHIDIDGGKLSILNIKTKDNLTEISYIKDKKKQTIYLDKGELKDFDFYKNDVKINSDLFDMEQPN